MPTWITAALTLAANFFGVVGKALGLVHDAEERQAGRQAQAADDQSATIRQAEDAQKIDSEIGRAPPDTIDRDLR